MHEEARQAMAAAVERDAAIREVVILLARHSLREHADPRVIELLAVLDE